MIHHENTMVLRPELFYYFSGQSTLMPKDDLGKSTFVFSGGSPQRNIEMSSSVSLQTAYHTSATADGLVNQIPATYIPENGSRDTVAIYDDVPSENQQPPVDGIRNMKELLQTIT